MTTADVLTFVVNTMFLLVFAGTIRLWLRHRSPATGWAVATFATISLVVLAGLLPDALSQNATFARINAAILLASPYLLYRFADAIAPSPRRLRTVAAGLTAAVIFSTLVLPLPLGQEDADFTGWAAAWFAGVLLFWALLDVAAGWLLIRASIGEPGVVRSRLRVLAVAAIGLGLYIPVSSQVSEQYMGTSAEALVQVISQSIVVGLAGLFLIGFAPPRLLRAAWRAEDERRLYEAAVGLMGAYEPDDVAAVLVPGVRQVMGAPAVTMRDVDGRVMASAGRDVRELAAVRDVMHRRIGEGDLELVVTPTMPIFGGDEYGQLDRLTLLANLALDRVRLLHAERQARGDVERLNEELEAFVYTTSHDLKNPVIALIGYLDVLVEDHEHGLPDDVQHIVQRMQVNARHMDSLIRDLLELSRVGRVDVTPDRVDLELLVDDVSRDVKTRHPALRVERGALPTLWMNPTRARQLFTNLLDNAAAYGGRDDITVSVTSEPLDHGVRVWVSDDGVGIPGDHLERIFGLFERLDPDRPGGTGMGLAICRRVVEHVGGTMVAVPSHDGAQFQIDLPASAVHVESISTGAAALEGTPT